MQDLTEYIEKSNKRFEKASPSKKRVIIAKDVILRIKAGTFISKSGTIISSSSELYHSKGNVKTLVNSGITCQGCAKGALFLSLIGRINNMNVEEFMDISDITKHGNDLGNSFHEKLGKFFSVEQMDLIETAFEQNTSLYTHINHYSASSFRKNNRLVSDEETLLAICNNIIFNKGEFIP